MRLNETQKEKFNLNDLDHSSSGWISSCTGCKFRNDEKYVDYLQRRKEKDFIHSQDEATFIQVLQKFSFLLVAQTEAGFTTKNHLAADEKRRNETLNSIYF